MKTITTLEELREEIESCEYNYYGLRKLTEHDKEVMERGYLDCSFDWIDGEQTTETLNGTCAVAVTEECDLESRLNQMKFYYGNVIALIADNRSEYGNDDNEIILGSNGYGADIVAIVEI